jgi:hypothetical protein
VQTNGARPGGQMVVSWTLFLAASQESGLSGLETGARPDEALAHFESGPGPAARNNSFRCRSREAVIWGVACRTVSPVGDILGLP